jgi:diguanylate cyclase (GGDEF)-like protein
MSGRFLRLMTLCGVALAAAWQSDPARASTLPLPKRSRYVFHKIGEDLGLGTSNPICLFQDREGFLWIGTDSGLLRYDGSRVVSFGPEQGLPGYQILQIAQTFDGRLWVATREALFFGVRDKFQKITLPAGVHELAAYQPLATDWQGRVYVATDAGLLVFPSGEPGNSQLLSNAQGIPGSGVQAVSPGNGGKIWFASGSHVGSLDQNLRVNLLLSRKEFSGQRIMAVVEEGVGQIWVRTGSQLMRLDPVSKRFVADPPNLPPANELGAPTTDREGRLMVPTVGGLYLHRESHWEVVNKRSGMPADSIASVLVDREGSYWLGSSGNGLVHWQGNRMWSGWTDGEGLPDNVVWAVHRDRRNRLWIGTNAGLAMWDSAAQRFRIWREKDGVSGSTAQQIVEGPDGSIWVLFRPGGFTRFDPDTLRPERVKVPGPEARFFGAALDGRLWVVGRNSVKALRSWKPPFLFQDVNIPPEILAGLERFRIAEGVLWAGGSQGLTRYDGKTWTQYTEKDGLKAGGVLELLAVGRDEAWVCYHAANGATQFRLRNGIPEVKHFGTAQGLRSEAVYMLGRDVQGNIWAGGDRGLAKIAAVGNVRQYSHAEGLIWDDINEGAFYGERDGTLLIGTSGGLARFDPQLETNTASTAPRVVITSAQLGGRERLGEASARVAHGENTLQVEFAVLSYRESADAACWYRLEGEERERTRALHREVRYAGLSPGRYEWEVTCQSRAGLRSDPARFAFEITPAWWQSWWARGVYLLLAGMAVYGFTWFRTYSLEQERRRLEQAVEERSAELAQAIRELEEASVTDALTGAHNRRFFQKSIEAGVQQTVRLYTDKRKNSAEFNRDLIFYLIDADHFKEINDRFGHDAGDELLVEITRRIKSAIRQSDDLIRWGGEEFLVVSRYTNRAVGTTLAERVLAAIGSRPFALKTAKEPVWMTCSVGWAAFPWFPEAPNAVKYQLVLEMADRALYQAKHSGRNRAVGLLPEQDQVSASAESAPEAPSRPNQLKTKETFSPGPARNAESE